MGLIIVSILISIYLFLPFKLQLICMAVNFLLPDMIFALDEIIMIAAFVKRWNRRFKILGFVYKHKVASIITVVIGYGILSYLVEQI